MQVKINTKIPFFLWWMTNREASIAGDKLTTKKVSKNEAGEEVVETFENTLIKTPSWLVALLKYFPLVLILLTGDWGYYMWNGIGMFFAAGYMYWFFWMKQNAPQQFYPVTIGSILVIAVVGLMIGKLLYANHIVSTTISLFLIKLLYDDIMFKQYDKYFTVQGKIGMFVYVPDVIKYKETNQLHITRFLVGVMVIGLVMITVNGAIAFKEYRAEQKQFEEYSAQEAKNALQSKSKKAELINVNVVEENLTKEQIQLREQLGIGE